MAGEEEIIPFGTFDWWLYAGFVVGCVLMAAMAAGLTMGLVAIEPLRLQILLETKVEHCTNAKEIKELKVEQECAKRLLPVVSKHHLLLVTLLLLNSLANECLPLFLDEIVPRVLAILLSVTFVLVFGEIVPSAIFTGPNQLTIASRFVPLVNLAICLLFPIAYPLSKLLDYLLGEEELDKFNKAELRALVKLHAAPKKKLKNATQRHDSSRSVIIQQKLEEIGVDQNTAAMAALATTAAQDAIYEEEQEFSSKSNNLIPSIVIDHNNNNNNQDEYVSSPVVQNVRLRANSDQKTVATNAEGLDLDEVMIMHGALDLKETTAEDKMIPLGHMYMISSDTKLTTSVLADIVACGHSRVPVFDSVRTNIRGILLIKKLIVLDPNDHRRIDTLYLRQPEFVLPSTSLLELLNIFQAAKSHMAIVTDNPDVMSESIRNDVPIPDYVNVFGLCTLEDIIETLIQEDIGDESDFHDSVKGQLFFQQRRQRIISLAMKQKSNRKIIGAAVCKKPIMQITTPNPSSKFKSFDETYGSTGLFNNSNGNDTKTYMQARSVSSGNNTRGHSNRPIDFDTNNVNEKVNPNSKTPLLDL